jgi:serine/threonine protein kinase
MSSQLKPGDHIGPYELLALLGEGGFARVWHARQQEPLPRDVALKILKPGMHSAEVLRCFHREQENLAQLDHPGITRVLNAGNTDAGQPYFVMEFVPDGEPLLQWCQQRSLTIVERLNLFLQLCAAIQHAHQKGVIHCDLHPNNVLVTQGQVKVIDFGIAKAIAEDSTTLLAGMPGFMSPEQASGNPDLDTRTDVFALGAMLHELTKDSAARDLHLIIRRAQDDDRTRRYSSVTALADDIRRFIAHEPITARPPTFTYIAGRLVRRHRVFATACVVALLLLGCGLGIALLQSKFAQQQQVQSEAMTNVLVGSWKSTTETETINASLPVMLLKVMNQITAPGFQGREVTRCKVLLKISEAAAIQADYQLGADAGFAALKIRREHPEFESELLIDCLTNIGNSISYDGKPKNAIPYLREALELSIQKAGPVSQLSLTRQRALGSALAKAGDPEALSVLSSAIKNAQLLGLADTHSDLLQARSDYAAALLNSGQTDEALSLLQKTAEHARSGGEACRDLLVRLLLRRGLLMVKLKRPEEAISAYEDAEKEWLRNPDPDKVMHFILRYNRSLSLMVLGRYGDAQATLEPLFEEQVRHYQITHTKPRSTALTLARCYLAQQQWKKLDHLLTRIFQAAPKLNHSHHNEQIEALAKHYDEINQPDQAKQWRDRITRP